MFDRELLNSRSLVARENADHSEKRVADPQDRQHRRYYHRHGSSGSGHPPFRSSRAGRDFLFDPTPHGAVG